MNIHLGYEVGSGREISVPLAHTAVTGQTQASGKTTTLEALIHRSERRAIAFLTKRGEGAFQTMVPVPPYFSEAVDWVLVKELLEAQAKTKLKFETSWIIEVSKGARNLQDVQDNIREAMYPKAIGGKKRRVSPMAMGVYTVLDAYLELLLPQIAALNYEKTLHLEPGLNVMDLTPYSVEMQGLVVRSVLQWVYQREKNVIVVIPEAWELLPESKGSPVRAAAEIYIRKGAVLGNYLFLDSQDLAGVNKAILRQVGVWILGVQREANEVMRTLKQFISKPARPKPDDLMSLGKGQFFVAYGTNQYTVYVQPRWMNQVHARAIATGDETIESAAAVYRDYLKQFKTTRAEATRSRVSVDDSMERQSEQSDREAAASTPRMEQYRGPATSGVPTPIPEGITRGPASPAPEPVNSPVAAPTLSDPPIRDGWSNASPKSSPLGENGTADAPFRGEKVGPAVPMSSPTEKKAMPNPALIPFAATRLGLNDEQLAAFYGFIRARILADPAVLAVLARPVEIRIIEQPKVLDMDGDSLPGQIARLIHEGFFAQPKKGYAVWQELVERRHNKFAKPSVYDALGNVARMGFLVRDGDGAYSPGAGMKITRHAAAGAQ